MGSSSRLITILEMTSGFPGTLFKLKEQLTPILNLSATRSKIPVHYVGTSFRSEICFILNRLTQIIIKSRGDADKTHR